MDAFRLDVRCVAACVGVVKSWVVGMLRTASISFVRAGSRAILGRAVCESPRLRNDEGTKSSSPRLKTVAVAMLPLYVSDLVAGNA